MKPISLNTPWNLWYHSIEDKSWTKSSYKHIFTLHNLYDLQGIREIIQQRHLQNGMFFLMRDDIFPTWEDPDNREGCCVSYKVPGGVLKEHWDNIVDRILTEDILLNTDDTELLNGVSIAPKKEFNIIKVWMRTSQTQESIQTVLKQYPPFYVSEKCIVKDHELSS